MYQKHVNPVFRTHNQVIHNVKEYPKLMPDRAYIHPVYERCFLTKNYRSLTKKIVFKIFHIIFREAYKIYMAKNGLRGVK